MAFDYTKKLTNPVDYPTVPADETAARKQFQDLLDEIAAAHNAHTANFESHGLKNLFVNVLAPPASLTAALGDGAGYDTAAINAISAYVRDMGGGTVFVPKPQNKYKLQSGTPINVYSNVKFEFQKGVIFDASEFIEGDKAFQAVGSAETPIALTADATENTNTVNIVPTGLNVDDWVKVSSNAVTGSTSQPKGEICRIETVGVDNITLYDPLCDSYLVSDGATVEKINFLENIEFEGTATIIGSTDTSKGITGLYFEYCNGVDIDKMRFVQTHYCGIQFVDCISTNVDKCRFKDIKQAGLAYGVAFSWACQDGTVSHCQGYRMRHLFSTGGGTSRKGIPRRITVSDCIATQMMDSGFDTHPGAEDITFINCHTLGSEQDGFSMQARSFKLIECGARNITRYGIMVQHLNTKPLHGIVGKSTVEYCGNSGIDILLVDSYPDVDSLQIEGNEVLHAGYGITQPTALTVPAKNVKVNNNQVHYSGNHGIWLRNLKKSNVDHNTVSDVNAAAESIYLQNCVESSACHNDVDGGIRGIRVLTGTDNKVNDNTIKNASVGILADNGTTYTHFVNNNARGCATPYTLGTGTGNVSANNIP